MLLQSAVVRESETHVIYDPRKVQLIRQTQMDLTQSQVSYLSKHGKSWASSVERGTDLKCVLKETWEDIVFSYEDAWMLISRWNSDCRTKADLELIQWLMLRPPSWRRRKGSKVEGPPTQGEIDRANAIKGESHSVS